MQPWAASFYKSRAWRQCRDGYASSVGGLCERCLSMGLARAGVIVHHKVHLTPDNISDPAVSMSWSNLELLCRDCHAAEHEPRRRRYSVDEVGRVLTRGV
jgi:5-methylcytosine-specific restriction endonuclease McrA